MKLSTKTSYNHIYFTNISKSGISTVDIFEAKRNIEKLGLLFSLYYEAFHRNRSNSVCHRRHENHNRAILFMLPQKLDLHFLMLSVYSRGIINCSLQHPSSSFLPPCRLLTFFSIAYKSDSLRCTITHFAKFHWVLFSCLAR